MKIAIAADHGGFEMKKALKKHYVQFEWLDLGTDSADSVDYPDMAEKIITPIVEKKYDFGIPIRHYCYAF